MLNNNFTQGKILPPLLKFSVPIFAALFLQAMYGAADLAIVGKFCNAEGISGVGTGSAVMMLATVLICGLCIGTTVMLGRKIGENKPEEGGKIIGASIVLFLIVSVVMTALMMIFFSPLAVLMQAPEEAFDETVTYVMWCSGGIVFITAYNVIGGIFRGLGNSKLPMIFVAISCVINILGDLLLVGVFKIGVAGAAIATVFAQAVSVLLSFVIIKKQKLPFVFDKSMIGFHKAEIGMIMKIGTPIAFQDALTHLSFLILNAIVNNIGLAQSSGYGIAERVTSFIFLVPSAIMSGVTAFVSQNYGAKQLQRAKKGTFLIMAVGSIGGIGLFLLGYFGGGFLSSLFTDDAAVVEQSFMYLKGFSADCLLTCVLFAFIGYFSGCGKTSYVMLQGISSSFLIRVPLSYIFSKLNGATLTTIGYAAPIATVYGIVFCIICFFVMNKKQKNTL